MATVLGKPALPMLLDALLHPSNAGKNRIITACIQLASDEQLRGVYHRCVPAVQMALKESFRAADRRDLLASLGVPREPAMVVEPEIIVLERTLASCPEHRREEAWNKTTLGNVWPHLHLRDPRYISPDSPLDLVETLFHLLETYPPIRSGLKSTYALPRVLNKRLLSFLKSDLPRTLALINKLCRWVDANGKHHVSLPEDLGCGKYYRVFWHALDLPTQRTHLEPFLADLVQSHDGALLKSGALTKLGVLYQCRWQVVHSIAIKALALIEGCEAEKERENIVAFVQNAIALLYERVTKTTSIDDAGKRRAQAALEGGAKDIIERAMKELSASLAKSEESDEEMVTKLWGIFLTNVLQTLDHHHSLVQVVFDSARGVFATKSISSGLLQGIAIDFLNALTPSTKTHLYSNIPAGTHDEMFQIALTLWPPREYIPFYTRSALQYLSRAQKDELWARIADPTYLIGQLTHLDSRSIALSAMKAFSPSPAARHHIVQAALAADGTDSIILDLYALCDITHPNTRAALEKMTYTRLFEDRFVVYRALMHATMAAGSVRVFADTMKFLVRRSKNEIPPDSERVCGLFDVGEVVGLMRKATEEEGREIAEVYMEWERQVNEGVSGLPATSAHILAIANHCLAIFVPDRSGVFFQMGLRIQWARCVHEHGLSKAKNQFVTRATAQRGLDIRDDSDEEEYRTFTSSLNANVDSGFYRIRLGDEAAYVEFLYAEHRRVFEPEVFDEGHPTWERVSRMQGYLDFQLSLLRAARGSGDVPAGWSQGPLKDAMQFVLQLSRLYRRKLGKRELPWWTEFRELRLESNFGRVEADLCYYEASLEAKRRVRTAKVDFLVERLVAMHDTAVYIPFVSQHIMDSRQDLLYDRFITTGKHGVFNLRPVDWTEGDENQPARWDFRTAPRFTPHQCGVFAQMFLNVIRSDEYPLYERVRSTEQYVKLPTTTIHELTALMDLNPRITETILMFLPNLDEPAVGIPLLLAPDVLGGELARTAVYSLKRALEHVPLGNVPRILEKVMEGPLRVGVFKELVRIVSAYLAFPEMQDMVRRLWERPGLHQDVRIALLRSILPSLGSPQQDLAWDIIDKAVAEMNTLQADDTLFVLLAVVPKVTSRIQDDVLRTWFPRSPVLTALGTIAIPTSQCERYAETVLWPLTQIRLNTNLAGAMKDDKKKSSGLAARVPNIRLAAYLACFQSFLESGNALSFAERAKRDALELVDAALEDYKPEDRFPARPEEQLFVYLVECIGHCVAHHSDAWKFLIEVIDFLAARVASLQQDPTPQGHRAIKQLHALHLADNFLFHNIEALYSRVPHETMELLGPLLTHGVQDFFATTFYRRRFSLYQRVAREARGGSGEDILPEARVLLAEIIKLSDGCHTSQDEALAKLTTLLGVIPAASLSVLRGEIMAGEHDVADAPWANSMQFKTLEKTYSCTPTYASQLARFHTHLGTNEPAFYAQHHKELESLIRKALNDSLARESKLSSSEAFEILISPLLARWPREEERDLLARIFKDYSSRFFTLEPDYAVKIVHDVLARARVGHAESMEQAREVVGLLIKHASAGMGSECSFPAAFYLEAIYEGRVSALTLNQLLDIPSAVESGLSFPCGDPSGVDIENRKNKATVAQIQGLYDEWKARNAASLIRDLDTTPGPTYSPNVALIVILDTYKTTPKLILANPNLFLSCIRRVLGDIALNSYATQLFDCLREEVLTPEMSTKWAPPLELGLSFAQKLLVEVPGEVVSSVGSTQSKLEGVELLRWWGETYFFSPSSGSYKQPLEAEGRERLVGVYEELRVLRVLAVRDAEAVVRVRALENLRMGSELGVGSQVKLSGF
ncbi:hypothetical protein FB45DRAFT_1122555 [Roridomyces roridus]|uniref:Uncharacterized protein n=1 Tax=Roridomyces roridus TaxID=1738132 RepID=A0AAD7B3V2_9AGAR|nr:hypothetical protein FB45DRAFT_1122555 [Roridomyces roridus]